ncbi:UNVERIFIED_CONTAM: hypothetical protein NY603_30090, partial [Bacteroidetes bacterium 56_B9]
SVSLVLQAPSSKHFSYRVLAMSAATVLNGQSSTLESDHSHHHHSHTTDFPEITPEKLAIMKLGSSLNDDRDVFSDPGTPSKYGKIGF